MILAAGLGTRLGRLVERTPKCLLTVAGEAILDTVLRNMADAGCRRVVVNVHHLPEKVEKHLDTRNNGVDVLVSREESLLDTGGGIRRAFTMAARPAPMVLIHNADIFTNVELSRLIRRHQDSGADATLMTRPACGDRLLLFDGDGGLVAWKNRCSGETRYPPAFDTTHPAYSCPPAVIVERSYCGICVASQGFIRFLSSLGAHRFGLVDAWLKAVSAGLVVRLYDMPSGCHVTDIGTPNGLALAREIAGPSRK